MTLVPKRPGGVIGSRAPQGRPDSPSYGASLPTYRTTYPQHIARRLFELAESNPTPDQYRQRKEAILADHQ